jgi:hypothetical protein
LSVGPVVPVETKMQGLPDQPVLTPGQIGQRRATPPAMFAGPKAAFTRKAHPLGKLGAMCRLFWQLKLRTHGIPKLATKAAGRRSAGGFGGEFTGFALRSPASAAADVAGTGLMRAVQGAGGALFAFPP